MSRALTALLLLVSAWAFAAERDDIFKRFDHGEHERAFARGKVSCVACHQVGGTGAGLSAEQLAETYMGPPRSVCHECHAPGEGELGGGGLGLRGSPRACMTCHANKPNPESHVAGWLQNHGYEASAAAATCRDCHTRSDCVDCHDRRENSEHRVHDPTWLTVHGIEARANPGGCDSCHVQAECTSCHSSGAGFGRTP